MGLPDSLYVVASRESAPLSRTSLTVTEQDRAPQTPGTDDTAPAQTMGGVVAEMRCTRGSRMPAELPRQTAPNHRFATQGARGRSAQRLLLGSARERKGDSKLKLYFCMKCLKRKR